MLTRGDWAGSSVLQDHRLLREAQSWKMAPALMGFASTNMREDLSASKEKFFGKKEKEFSETL